MNLRSEISDRLWESIANRYENGNYAHAVVDSIHVLTNTLREKSGLDGDGNQLVGGALGGESQKIKLNSLQTDTEKNIQKGFEAILRGIYSAIRNPRSHEAASDRHEDADAIICFVNYLLTVLDASKEAFTIESFIKQITDPDFVDSERYSGILISEIPPARVGDTLIAIYSLRKHLPLQKRQTFIAHLLKSATDSQMQNFLAIVSEQLKSTSDTSDIRTTFQFLTPDLWPRLSEAARLRIENKIVTGIRSGKVAPDGSTSEGLATWASDFLRVFDLRKEAAAALWLKIISDDPESRHYAAQFFFRELPKICTTEKEIARAISAIVKAVEEGDQHVRGALLRWVDVFPDDWQKTLVDALSELTSKENPAHILVDGTPFLTAEEKSDFDDDIPF
jgi:uncharacterized protein (TIGR02391 family)